MAAHLERLFGRLAVAGPSRLPQLSRSATTAAAAPVASTSSSAPPTTALATPESTLEPARWTPGAARTGVLAVKKGMTAMFDSHGERIPATVLQLDSCYVFNHKLRPHLAVQVCSTPRRHAHKAMRTIFEKAGVPISQKAAEFRVDQAAMIPIGERLRAAHFVPGQFVDVQAKTKGKGLTGVMKRWGFAGQSASHGNTKAHRKAGSIGASARPARVHRNKKMSGRQGGLNKMLMSSLVLRIDTELDLIFVKGPVPGPRGGHVRVMDARNRAPGPSVLSLPYPAATDSALAQLGELPREITLNTVNVRDPHAPVE